MSEVILPCYAESGVLLASRAYYGIGGTTRFLALPESVAELSGILVENRTYRLPLALMGSGSNLLFSDGEYPGIVISLERMQRCFWLSDNELFCEAGVENTRIAEELFSAGKGGGEWLYRLPGQIGATVRMNARCFGGEISDCTAGILVLSVDGCLRWCLPSEIFCGYKHTTLMDTPDIVVAVVLKFPCDRPAPDIIREMRRFEKERLEKHHFDFPSCGSVFKNNYSAGRSSGMIFDELGFRGQSEGGAMVSEHHANFIYNRAGATAEDVLRLAARMRTAALEKAGVQLDLEVQCVGLFDVALLESCGVSFVTDSRDSSKGWAGLLWMPDNELSDMQDVSFPRLLMHGPLVAYFGLDREFPAGVFVKVEQLCSCSDAALSPEAPFLRWTTLSNSPALFSLKPDVSPGFQDKLWLYSVSELFLASTVDDSYLEFEMTPGGHWVALRFDSPRTLSKGSEPLVQDNWHGQVHLLQEEECFGMELSWKLLEPFIGDTRFLAVQCSASSGRGEFGLFPWWQAPAAPADFHQPDQFFPICFC